MAQDYIRHLWHLKQWLGHKHDYQIDLLLPLEDHCLSLSMFCKPNGQAFDYGRIIKEWSTIVHQVFQFVYLSKRCQFSQYLGLGHNTL